MHQSVIILSAPATNTNFVRRQEGAPRPRIHVRSQRMETIWKILGASGLISLVVFMQVLSCVFFRKHNDHDGNPLDEYNNTCARATPTCTRHPRETQRRPPARVALMPGCC